MNALFANLPDLIDPVEDVRGLVTRRRILNAARELLRVQNYRSFSMEGVAGLSGLSRRTVYNLFADRDALYHASRADLLREFDPLLPVCATALRVAPRQPRGILPPGADRARHRRPPRTARIGPSRRCVRAVARGIL